jgi:DNA-directed RNA polymerase specialized sigma24 family protein
MSWNDLNPDLRHTIETVCTPKELDALRLHLCDIGYTRIAVMLDISPSTARDRIRRARRKLAAALRTKEAA